MRAIHLIVAAFVIAVLAGPAAAQTGRATGLVIDVDGRPIKGAIIRATNPQAAYSVITSTTDDRGRFAMIGLRAGVWAFAVEAPGYVSTEGTSPIRQGTPGPPMRFVLQRSPEPVPGALSRNISDDLADAQALRAQGRYDQALAAYREIQEKHPKLTTLHLVIAGVYRQQAETAPDAASRRALFDRAIAAYAELLQTETENGRARLELGATHAAAGNVAAARTTLQELIASQPGSQFAGEATALLQSIPE
jgi:tetratricopeptide (TPR) repeat protein